MEENILKQKYNELLERYKKGAEYLSTHQDSPAAQEKLKEIENELSKIIEALPDMTETEKTEGFKPDTAENTVESAEVTTEQKAITVKQDPTPTTNLSTFKDNWNMAVQLAKSDIIPDNYKNKPQNVVIAIRYRKPNEFRSIYSNAKYGIH